MGCLKLDNQHMRGQIWSVDAIIGVLLLLSIMFISTMIWNSVTIANRNAEQYNDLWLAAMQASDIIVLTPGDPAGWENLASLNDSSLNSIGLAESRNVLSVAKLFKMQQLNASNSSYYFLFQDKLGLGIKNYSITVSTLNGSIINEVGIKPKEDVQKVHVERFAVMNGSVVKLVLEVWG